MNRCKQAILGLALKVPVRERKERDTEGGGVIDAAVYCTCRLAWVRDAGEYVQVWGCMWLILRV